MRSIGALALLLAAAGFAQPRKILYVTHSAGFRHSTLPLSAQVLEAAARSSGKLALEHTEDLERLSLASLREFHAVLFYTSGELALTEIQKGELLEWVRSGKGFGGAHSATDTLYNWPEYGELIGARFHGHPWTQAVGIDVEDPDHPATGFLKPSFRILDEIYQFRDFSRQRSRVLLTLDTGSVNLGLSEVNPGTDDFPLAWCHRFGSGRVFYTALGHFESTWEDGRFQRMMLEAMLWLAGLTEKVEASPRGGLRAEITPEGIANAASFQPAMTVSPGSLITIFGRNLTNGSTLESLPGRPSPKLAGTRVRMNGETVPLLYVSPSQVNALAPLGMRPQECPQPPVSGCRGPYFPFEISIAGGTAASTSLEAAQATPGVFTFTARPGVLTFWATGLGPVERRGEFDVTVLEPAVRIGGQSARVLFSGLAPGWPGLYQVDAELPTGLTAPAPVEFELAGAVFRGSLNPLP